MKRIARVAIPVLILLGLIAFRLVQKRLEARAEATQRAARLRAPIAVSVAPVRVQNLVTTYSGVGSVDPPLSVRLAAQISGRVDFLEVHEGDRIYKGQDLIRIDPSEVEAQAQTTESPTDVSTLTLLQQDQAAVTTAQTDLDQATQDYERQVAAAQEAVADRQAVVRSAQTNLSNAKEHYSRQVQLSKQGFVATQDLDDAKTAVGVQQAALDSAVAELHAAQHQADIVKTTGQAAVNDAQERLAEARAALKFAQANLAQQPAYKQNLAALRAAVTQAGENLKAAQARRTYTVLSAPFDGFVTGRFMDPGATAIPGSPILAVQYMKQVWVTIAVPPDVAEHVTLGRPAPITFDALPGQSFSGKVIQLNPSADPQSRQFTVRFVLDNRDLVIKPGMFAHVVIETSSQRAIVVPREALQHDRGGDYVMVIEKSLIARRRAVKLGPASVGVIALSAGVRPGELVATLSGQPLKDGQGVTISRARPAAPPADGYGSGMGY